MSTESLTKEAIEKWVFDKVRLIEVFVIGYVKACIGIIFSPKRTLTNLLADGGKISPLFYFLLNVILVTADGKSLSDLFKYALKNVLVTTKPAWDDSLFLFTSYIVGLIVFVIVFHFAEKNLFSSEINTEYICKAFMCASFCFIPITILNKLIYLVLNPKSFSFLMQIIDSQDSNAALIVLFCTFAIKFVYLCYWIYLLNLGLNIMVKSYNNRIALTIFSAIILFSIVDMGVSICANASKLEAFISAVQAKIQCEDALKKSPPDYRQAGMTLWTVANNEVLTPYMKYKNSIKSISYIMAFLQHPAANKALKDIANKSFETVETLYVVDIEKSMNLPMTQLQRMYFQAMKDDLDNAKKQRKLSNYLVGDDLLSIQIGISTDKTYLKLLP
jgi:hypothetical protein